LNLILGIESSSDRYSVIFCSGGRILFDSSGDAASQAAPESAKNLPFLVRCGIEHIGQAIADIQIIAVDIGPGNLGSVRTGVAFANGLGFSLNKPILPLTAFALLGMEAAGIIAKADHHGNRRTDRHVELPILCIRKASAGNVFVGLYHAGIVSAMRFGPIAPTVSGVAALAVGMGEGRFAIAGALRAECIALLPQALITDSGVEIPQARTMLHIDMEQNAAFLVKQVSPLNEQSGIFQ
jgi:tRNA threonylcarbamoyladenosine biosynthesis protein TsaB